MRIALLHCIVLYLQRGVPPYTLGWFVSLCLFAGFSLIVPQKCHRPGSNGCEKTRTKQINGKQKPQKSTSNITTFETENHVTLKYTWPPLGSGMFSKSKCIPLRMMRCAPRRRCSIRQPILTAVYTISSCGIQKFVMVALLWRLLTHLLAWSLTDMDKSMILSFKAQRHCSSTQNGKKLHYPRYTPKMDPALSHKNRGSHSTTTVSTNRKQPKTHLATKSPQTCMHIDRSPACFKIGRADGRTPHQTSQDNISSLKYYMHSTNIDPCDAYSCHVKTFVFPEKMKRQIFFFSQLLR